LRSESVSPHCAGFKKFFCMVRGLQIGYAADVKKVP
jgi:hypothetical protein